ncbi:unnamed protein product, partial [Ectocarpus fasciculatus]
NQDTKEEQTKSYDVREGATIQLLHYLRRPLAPPPGQLIRTPLSQGNPDEGNTHNHQIKQIPEEHPPANQANTRRTPTGRQVGLTTKTTRHNRCKQQKRTTLFGGQRRTGSRNHKQQRCPNPSSSFRGSLLSPVFLRTRP